LDRFPRHKLQPRSFPRTARAIPSSPVLSRSRVDGSGTTLVPVTSNITWFVTAKSEAGGNGFGVFAVKAKPRVAGVAVVSTGFVGICQVRALLLVPA